MRKLLIGVAGFLIGLAVVLAAIDVSTRVWQRFALTLGVLAVAALGWFGMHRGWRRRQREQADLPGLPALPDDAGETMLGPVAGLYVGTTGGGGWLDRITVHDLSARSRATLRIVSTGLLIERAGPAAVYVPAEALRDARTDSAHAGSVIGPGGLLVLTWSHGDHELETGFRADDHTDNTLVADAVRQLLGLEVQVPAEPEPEPAATDEQEASEPEATPESAPDRRVVRVTPAAVPAESDDLAAALAAGPIENGDEQPVPEETPEPVAATAPEPAVGRRSDVDPLTSPIDLVQLWAQIDMETPPEVERMAAERAAQPTMTPAVTPGGTPLIGTATRPALLVLEDGRVFRGEAFGAAGETFGEAVFNTGMTGYQETLTDPSYHRQVVVMTAPHIGNTGVNDEDPESLRIWVAGYVVRDPARLSSNWRAKRSLHADLESSGVVGISGVDTRALTRHLRERGAMRVGVSSVETDPAALLDRVLASPTMEGSDLATEVSTPEAYVVPAVGERRFRVAALDLGIKRSTPVNMAQLGCEVHVLPATATIEDLLAVEPDGVFFSNGPGDPATCDYAVTAMRGALDRGVPTFGICFGNQILGRALGLGTYKLKYGHRGVNQPVMDRDTRRVAITSHNHGFAVAADLEGAFDTPYGRAEVSHVDLNDGVVEGLRLLERPAFSVQYHPEAAPGPHDANNLFAAFAQLMESGKVNA